MELLRDLKGANHRMPVFSQFTDFLAIVEARIQQEVFPFRYLDGVTTPQERERRVAAFQRGEGDLFLLSLKAGGMGLNLTAANYVVLLECTCAHGRIAVFLTDDAIKRETRWRN